MAETIQRKLNDSPAARWTALLLIASTMFFGYMFVDLMSPLQSMIEAQRGWTPDVFGMYGSSEFILNVFGFLILAGIILDKMGVRFTGQLSASLMFIGACLKYYAVSDSFAGSGIETWLGSWWTSFPASAKLASLGFMIFGCGMEMAGITVSKAIAKWFEGKEMALAMGLEMAIARVGVFAIFSISPWLADMAPATVVRPVAFCTVLLLIGLLTFVIFSFMDRKLDKQLGLDSRGGGGSEEEFKVSDLKYILSSKVFWIIAFLCVLYYSAIFPFQRFATNMLESNLGVSAQTAADIFRWFPMGAAAITPFLGRYLDHKGKGATMRLPPDLRLRAPGVPEQARRLRLDRPARHLVLAGSGRTLALGSEDRGDALSGFRLFADILDSEHRTVPFPDALRLRTQIFQRRTDRGNALRLHPSDADFRRVRRAGDAAGTVAQGGRPQKEIRAGTAQYQEVAQATPE